MKQTFYSLFLFAIVSLYVSCMEGTDIEQLYEERYAPQYCPIDYYHELSHITATSATFTYSLVYDVKIKEAQLVIGTDADDVKQGLGQITRYFSTTIGRKSVDINEVSNNLLPNTVYYYHIIVIDDEDQPHTVECSQFKTKGYDILAYRSNTVPCPLVFKFHNVGPLTVLGYEVDYDPDFSNPKKYIKDVNQYYDPAVTTIDIETCLDTILPRHTIYYRPFAMTRGITHYGDTLQRQFNHFTVTATIQVEDDRASIAIGYPQYSSYCRELSIGVCVADHPITEDNPGDRYVIDQDSWNNCVDLEGLIPGTTYYVRPFASYNQRIDLWDEQQFSL